MLGVFIPGKGDYVEVEVEEKWKYLLTDDVRIVVMDAPKTKPAPAAPKLKVPPRAEAPVVDKKVSKKDSPKKPSTKKSTSKKASKK